MYEEIPVPEKLSGRASGAMVQVGCRQRNTVFEKSGKERGSHSSREDPWRAFLDTGGTLEEQKTGTVREQRRDIIALTWKRESRSLWRTFWERIIAGMPESRSGVGWRRKGQRSELYFLRTGFQKSVRIRHFI